MKFYGQARIATDIESRVVGSTSVVKFRVACDRAYKDKSGERPTDFLEMECWAERGETIAKFFQKGDPIYLEGSPKVESWDNAEGEKRSKVIFSIDNFEFVLKPNSKNSAEKGDREEESPAPTQSRTPKGKPASAPKRNTPKPAVVDDGDDDIPF